MDGRQFFLDPQTPAQRRYEAIRAVVVERQPLSQAAERFGYAYGTLRNLVSHFHGQCRAGQISPFLPRRHVVGHLPPTARTKRGPKPRTSLIADCWR